MRNRELDVPSPRGVRVENATISAITRWWGFAPAGAYATVKEISGGGHVTTLLEAAAGVKLRSEL